MALQIRLMIKKVPTLSRVSIPLNFSLGDDVWF